MVSKYSKGARFENKVKDMLIEDDWLAVRAAGSHGIIDILAVKYGVIWGIQCRSNGYLSPDERKEIIALARKHKAVPILAYEALVDVSLDDKFKVKKKMSIILEEIKPKEVEFYYEIVDGRFIKVDKKDAG